MNYLYSSLTFKLIVPQTEFFVNTQEHKIDIPANHLFDLS